MFRVVEFSANCGGGLGIIRGEWLTPRKKECFWPPHKLAANYNKALVENHVPEENWALCEIERQFYETEDILKAREKLKSAEYESDVQTDSDLRTTKRKRKAARKLYESESEDEGEGLPPNKSSCQSQSFHDSLPSEDLFSPLSHIPSTPAQSALNVSPDRQSTSKNNNTKEDKTSFEVIAKHLANIDAQLTTIYENQLLILERLNLPNNLTDHNTTNSIPSEINNPCSTEEDIHLLEKWIEKEENRKSFDCSLSRCGGTNLKIIIHRLLTKLFTNELALQYNWTGKFNKKPLKNRKIIEVIQESVRRNPYATKNSDLEIVTVISNWFRFARDRDGGRDRRRAVRPTET